MNDDERLVAAWDLALTRPPWQRPGALVDALAPIDNPTAAIDQPLGAAAQRFVRLAGRWFGHDIDAVAECDQCAQQLAFTLALDSFTDNEEPPPSVGVQIDGRHLQARLPTATDLAWAASAGDVGEATMLLARRCLIDAAPDALTDQALTDEALTVISDALEAADPMASIALAVQCADCGHEFTYTLDVGAWCWTMAQAQVARLLDEVHLLATAYGWTEAEVLALGPNRRDHYLELVA